MPDAGYRRALPRNEAARTVVIYATLPVGKVVGEFEIFYSLTQDTVHVLSVWRGTRDPVGRPY